MSTYAAPLRDTLFAMKELGGLDNQVSVTTADGFTSTPLT